uniref:Uncharacterized protein n=1 Tax=Strombidinopsis acuminata TaxID=141414 RepID=A0A7S3SFT6_9SPIT
MAEAGSQMPGGKAAAINAFAGPIQPTDIFEHVLKIGVAARKHERDNFVEGLKAMEDPSGFTPQDPVTVAAPKRMAGGVSANLQRRSGWPPGGMHEHGW